MEKYIIKTVNKHKNNRIEYDYISIMKIIIIIKKMNFLYSRSCYRCWTIINEKEKYILKGQGSTDIFNSDHVLVDISKEVHIQQTSIYFYFFNVFFSPILL